MAWHMDIETGETHRSYEYLKNIKWTSNTVVVKMLVLEDVLEREWKRQKTTNTKAHYFIYLERAEGENRLTEELDKQKGNEAATTRPKHQETPCTTPATPNQESSSTSANI